MQPIAILLATVLAGQPCAGPRPEAGLQAPGDGAVRGEVRSGDGTGVGRARVRVVAAPAIGPGTSPFAHHALDVLARHPLEARTAEDGTFMLDLTPAHRRLGTGFEPPLVLVIEAEGHAPWHEPLPFGLTGFAGTRARLHRWTEEDRHEVVVVDPRPGDLLQVTRIDAGTSFADVQVVAVPDDGIVHFHAPLLPAPIVFEDWRHARAVGHEARLWSPGRSSPPVRLDPRGRSVRIAATDRSRRTLRVLGEGTVAAGVRGLYDCPDGTRRWFPAADGIVREDEALHLVAVTAKGRATAMPAPGAFGDVHLARAVQRELTLPVAVHGEADPPRRLAAWLVPLERAGDAWRARGLASRDAPPVAVEGARLRLDLAAWQSHLLLIAAADCPLQTFPPPSGDTVPAALALHRAPLIDHRLRVLAGEQPAPGVEVRLAAPSLARCPRPAVTPLTDGTGIAALPPLPRGQHELLCVGEEGFARVSLDLSGPGDALAAGTIAGSLLRAQLRTPDGAPAAFAAVTIESTTQDGGRRVRQGTSDALGGVHVAYLGEGVRFDCRGIQHSEQAPAGGVLLELEVPEIQPVLVQLPAGARVQRVTYWFADGGVRNENLDLAADHLLVGWRTGCSRCDIVLADGPPATLSAEDLRDPAAARGVPRVARQEIVRRVPLHVFCRGAPVTGFAARPARASGLLLVYDHREGSPLHEGAWSARDRAAHEVRVFHPEFLPSAPVHIKAVGSSHEPALLVELVRGAPVRLRVPSDLGAGGRDVVVAIADGGVPRYHLTLPAPAPGDGPAAELLLPFALPPGGYAVEARGPRRTYRMAVSVGADGAVVVEDK